MSTVTETKSSSSSASSASTAQAQPLTKPDGFYFNPRLMRRLEKEVATGPSELLHRVCTSFGQSGVAVLAQQNPVQAVRLSDLLIRGLLNQDKMSSLSKKTVENVVFQIQKAGSFRPENTGEEVTIQCKDGEVRCNKGLLLLMSDVCVVMLSTTGRKKSIDFSQDVHVASIESLKQFLYSGQIAPLGKNSQEKGELEWLFTNIGREDLVAEIRTQEEIEERVRALCRYPFDDFVKDDPVVRVLGTIDRMQHMLTLFMRRFFYTCNEVYNLRFMESYFVNPDRFIERFSKGEDPLDAVAPIVVAASVPASAPLLAPAPNPPPAVGAAVALGVEAKVEFFEELDSKVRALLHELLTIIVLNEKRHSAVEILSGPGMQWQKKVILFQNELRDSASRFFSNHPDYRQKLVALAEVLSAKFPVIYSPTVQKKIEAAGFQLRPIDTCRERCVCEGCGVVILGVRPWMDLTKMHDLTRHSLQFHKKMGALNIFAPLSQSADIAPSTPAKAAAASSSSSSSSSAANESEISQSVVDRRTAKEHYEWCKKRAFPYIEKNHFEAARVMFLNDMTRHKGTKHAVTGLGGTLLQQVPFHNKATFIHFLNGFKV